MSESKKIIISGKNLVENEVLNINTTLANNKYFFLKGIVYTPKGETLPNAAIEVFEVDNSTNPPQKYSIGVTFTIEDGSYGISLLTGKSYVLVVYS
ncbi:carboxypeptidase regulatory-like domain-containing protein [Romboutsia maritimum]|uniref:Carboxypeptidase regulatory-like domain-containing protein n=1 Tax=Romboutsia maritimum TaxID=2020948 RepID=A0A371IS74_9FIRM|nr:carboxypeptidase regulatory-like domain-containing protein [Romboutsia maritimum]RDY23319.1 carboxypeptidase regulatory-like domain-containing protein [Romboutsia maritimum]